MYTSNFRADSVRLLLRAFSAWTRFVFAIGSCGRLFHYFFHSLQPPTKLENRSLVSGSRRSGQRSHAMRYRPAEYVSMMQSIMTARPVVQQVEGQISNPNMPLVPVKYRNFVGYFWRRCILSFTGVEITLIIRKMKFYLNNLLKP